MSSTLPALSTGDVSECERPSDAHCAGMPAPRARALTPVESAGAPLASTFEALPGRLSQGQRGKLRADVPLRVAKEDGAGDGVEGGARGELLHRVDSGRRAL